MTSGAQGLSRRALLGATLLPTALPTVQALDPADWALFRARFINADGRLIDTGNKGISHTEGQGWSLLFAVANDDRPTFETVLDWTRRILKRPNDALHVWRYDPARRNPVEDRNNATDGDIFIAAALARAARRWGVPDYTHMARQIAADILRLLVRERGDRAVLLPGIMGFDAADRLVANPSYYAFPFMAELAVLNDAPRWEKVMADGLQLLADGRFGDWMLSPDWLEVGRSDHLSPATGWPPRFSFDAVRVPLWLCWRRLGSPALTAPVTFWDSYRDDKPPAWIDLSTGEKAPYPLTPGMTAVARLATASAHGQDADLPPLSAAPQYYDAALIMLCRMAHAEMSQQGLTGR